MSHYAAARRIVSRSLPPLQEVSCHDKRFFKWDCVLRFYDEWNFLPYAHILRVKSEWNIPTICEGKLIYTMNTW